MTDLLPKKTHPPRASLTSSTNSGVPSEVNSEYAIGLLVGTSMHGATGNINVWQPQVHPSEVTPFNPEPRVFIYWTSDGYKSKGCYNLDCPGFVQTNSKGVLGSQLQPVSKYGDTQQRIITITFRRDLNNGNWWLVFQGVDIGYWPAELFKNLKTTSKLIEWGGNVINTKVGRFQTASEMGSGHYPTEGFGKAAFFSKLGILNEDGEFVDADGVVVQATKPGCYNIDLNDKTENWGSYPFDKEDHNSSKVHTQFWERNGYNCPQGIVPILRKSVTDLLPKKTHPPRASSTSSTNSSVPSEVNTEYAIGLLEWMNMHGSTGEINVWQPRVYPSEVSTSQIWISDNPVGTIESIQAGYMVTPSNPEPRVFVFWTLYWFSFERETVRWYKSKGCYNLDCPWFIQTSGMGLVGGLIQPISKYGGNQQTVTITFRRDLKYGNWWFILQGEDIGYWPAELFKNLNTTAKLIEWGGCVVNTKVGKSEIASEMGSGHFPTEGSTIQTWLLQH
ncbi:hypothetical protein LINPERHAP2_LOCUS27891 [Linum perenne]